MQFSNCLLVWFFLFFNLMSNAQNVQTHKVDVGSIERLQLNLDEVFAVEIVTGDFSTIRIISEAEGEYAKELQLQMKQIDQTLYINSLFEAILTSGFDKLSSHKVFAFQVKIYVPEQFQVFIKSNIAELDLVGKLAYLQADLKNGDCSLKNHQGDVKINTYRGNINIHTQDAKVRAETRTGKLQLEEANYKKYTLELKSVAGHIQVFQLN
ncbi:DUF4097 family beta strand repeat-containing protein [Psychroflexus planctonicus]|nr:DUF4097 family beta strand repeat-containing protein [Psychroflexus planctonicus]